MFYELFEDVLLNGRRRKEEKRMIIAIVFIMMMMMIIGIENVIAAKQDASEAFALFVE